jgi:hypothetical protein
VNEKFSEDRRRCDEGDGLHTSSGISFMSWSETLDASGADLAKFWRYLSEKVSETACESRIWTPISSSSSFC